MDLPLPAGRLSELQICLHEPKAHMQTYLYGTAKETEPMLHRIPQTIAPTYLLYEIKNNMSEFHCRVCKVPPRGDLGGLFFFFYLRTNIKICFVLTLAAS